MKVLVAGATGAIGRPLIRLLKQSGHAVFGLRVRLIQKAPWLRWVRWRLPAMRSMPRPSSPRFNGFDRMPSSTS